MSDLSTAKPIDEITRLRARVRDLEAQLNKSAGSKSDDEDSARTTTRRVADSMSDISRSKVDASNRIVRSTALASAEFVRAFADTVSSFADMLVSRNEGRKDGSRTARDLVTRLPEDIATSFADAIDRFVEVPAKSADRYASAYRSGEKTNS